MLFHNQNSRLSLFLQHGYPAISVLSGLLVAQIIATAQVYLSNMELQAGLELINSAGYLTIPNQPVMDRLREFGPAIYGGLFFTMSVGAGLSIPAFGASWVWIRIFSGNRWSLLLFLIPWFLSLVVMNIYGFSPFVSAYFLFVPATVFQMTRKLMPSTRPERPRSFRFIHFGWLILFGTLWTWQMDSNAFMAIRDHLLLSNTLGKKLNDFYYRYTFYPAEVLKPLNRKTLKTCFITQSVNDDLNKALKKILLDQDYLPMENITQVDLTLRKEGEEILLQQAMKTVMRTTVPDFLAMGSIRLKEFSRKTDRYVYFRKFLFFSMLTGLPGAVYLFLYLLVRSFASIFLKPDRSGLIASFICFGAGAALLTVITPQSHKKMDWESVNEILESENEQKRITALKNVLGKRKEISGYRAYEKLLKSPHTPDRYWLTKSLAFSRNPETYEDLLVLLDDSSPNVVSMAYWALGLRGDGSAIPEILKRIPISNDWYNQWYAYNALRDLGWTQSKR